MCSSGSSMASLMRPPSARSDAPSRRFTSVGS
ncbi:MAG: hypothetical protein QOD87_1528, partial [Pseudonocardiales bacterium]|nr:hypothetical protein [Pseudonocardiales bacterium]